MSAAARSHLTTGNSTEFFYNDDADAFPQVRQPVRPFGDYGLFQIRRTKKVSRGGIILVEETLSAEHYNTQVAKVIALGPLCFTTQISVDVVDAIGAKVGEKLHLADWPEGRWFDVGAYVRVPKYSGDRLTATWHPKGGDPEEIIFVLFRARQILALENDPLISKAYID